MLCHAGSEKAVGKGKLALFHGVTLGNKLGKLSLHFLHAAGQKGDLFEKGGNGVVQSRKTAGGAEYAAQTFPQLFFLSRLGKKALHRRFNGALLQGLQAQLVGNALLAAQSNFLAVGAEQGVAKGVNGGDLCTGKGHQLTGKGFVFGIFRYHFGKLLIESVLQTLGGGLGKGHDGKAGSLHRALGKKADDSSRENAGLTAACGGADCQTAAPCFHRLLLVLGPTDHHSSSSPNSSSRLTRER